MNRGFKNESGVGVPPLSPELRPPSFWFVNRIDITQWNLQTVGRGLWYSLFALVICVIGNENIHCIVEKGAVDRVTHFVQSILDHIIHKNVAVQLSQVILQIRCFRIRIEDKSEASTCFKVVEFVFRSGVARQIVPSSRCQSPRIAECYTYSMGDVFSTKVLIARKKPNNKACSCSRLSGWVTRFQSW